MNSRSRSRSAGVLAMGVAILAVALLTGVFGGTALASNPPVNTALPTISPSTPQVATEATASTGTWSSEAPVYWLDEGLTPFREGESVSLTADGNPITFAATVGGISGSITCDATVTRASLENPTGGGGGTGGAEIAYSNCTAGGNWSSCTVAFGAAVPVKSALTTFEGESKLTLSPTGANLGTFTLSGSRCLVATSYKLIGVINGAYSNDDSQIYFDMTTTATGLRLQNALGPRTTATGSIGLEEAGGGDIKADAMTYSYAWNRCTGGTCTAISGATGSSYTPTSADLGKTLTVSVTASDAIGRTTATSNRSGVVTSKLSWYVFDTSWIRPSSTPFTSSNSWDTGGNYISLDWTSGGTNYKIQCSGADGEGTLSNGETEATIDDFELTLSGCAYTSPGIECDISSGGVGDALVFNTMEAVTTSDTDPELKFTPVGWRFLDYTVSNCAHEGTYYFSGWFPATFDNEDGLLVASTLDIKANRSMHFLGATGPVAGIDGAQQVLSEGEDAVKLDIEP